MAWIIRASAKNRVRSIVWKSRAGCLTLRAECGEVSSMSESQNNMSWIGVHGAHGVLHAASMSDAATLAHQRLRPSSVAILGNLNADMREPSSAPAHMPPADGPRESERESPFRPLLRLFACRFAFPSTCLGGGGGGGI